MNSPLRLLDQQDALWGYLDDLLREVPPHTIEDEPDPPAPVPAPAVLRPEFAEPAAVPSAGARAGELPAAEPAEVSDTASRCPPEWAEPDFQALIFHVGPLNLAVPLVKLQSVIPWNEQISALPNQPPWCHGAFHYRERNVVVIDTARLVLPRQHRDDAAPAEIEKAHILIVGDGCWGLACRTVGEVVRLRPDEVKWRGAGGQRPWLAGTVLGRLCALMDTSAFADMLNTAQVR